MKKAITVRIFAAAFAGLVSSALPALAISNEAECREAVAETSGQLLQAQVNAEQLAAIDSSIRAANDFCTVGDFAAAEGALSEARASIRSAQAN